MPRALAVAASDVAAVKMVLGLSIVVGLVTMAGPTGLASGSFSPATMRGRVLAAGDVSGA